MYWTLSGVADAGRGVSNLIRYEREIAANRALLLSIGYEAILNRRKASTGYSEYSSGTRLCHFPTLSIEMIKNWIHFAISVFKFTRVRVSASAAATKVLTMLVD